MAEHISCTCMTEEFTEADFYSRYRNKYIVSTWPKVAIPTNSSNIMGYNYRGGGHVWKKTFQEIDKNASVKHPWSHL